MTGSITSENNDGKPPPHTSDRPCFTARSHVGHASVASKHTAHWCRRSLLAGTDRQPWDFCIAASTEIHHGRWGERGKYSVNVTSASRLYHKAGKRIQNKTDRLLWANAGTAPVMLNWKYLMTTDARSHGYRLIKHIYNLLSINRV